MPGVMLFHVPVSLYEEIYRFNYFHLIRTIIVHIIKKKKIGGTQT